MIESDGTHCSDVDHAAPLMAERPYCAALDGVIMVLQLTGDAVSRAI
jgi:hypothetical protein